MGKQEEAPPSTTWLTLSVPSKSAQGRHCPSRPHHLDQEKDYSGFHEDWANGLSSRVDLLCHRTRDNKQIPDGCVRHRNITQELPSAPYHSRWWTRNLLFHLIQYINMWTIYANTRNTKGASCYTMPPQPRVKMYFSEKIVH